MHLCVEKMIKAIQQRWRLLSGLDGWQNLLDPLDCDLQHYLLHYGSMAQATYDTFNSEKESEYAGSSRYARRNLFSEVGLVKGNPFKYKAVKFVYATSSITVPESFILKPPRNEAWCGVSNWMGFVAVATDEGKVALGRRDIVVAWRGTIVQTEWLKDLDFPLVPASTIVGKASGSAKVHHGVLSLYTSADPDSKFNKTSARDQVLSEVTRLLNQYAGEEVSITIIGHSLGGALALLSAADIACNGHNQISCRPHQTSCPVTAFLYGTMRLGDSKFRDILESRNDLHILCIRNAPDIVPFLPAFGYSNVGVELQVDSRNSPYLKQPGGIRTWHSLEAAYLHPLAMENRSEGKREIALVNRSSDALKDEMLIPVNWWVEKNKGMVQMDDGRWILEDHQTDEDDPQVPNQNC